MIGIQNFNFIIWKFLQMSKLLYNILKISGEQMPQMPPPWLRACIQSDCIKVGNHYVIRPSASFEK